MNGAYSHGYIRLPVPWMLRCQYLDESRLANVGGVESYSVSLLRD